MADYHSFMHRIVMGSGRFLRTDRYLLLQQAFLDTVGFHRTVFHRIRSSPYLDYPTGHPCRSFPGISSGSCDGVLFGAIRYRRKNIGSHHHRALWNSKACAGSSIYLVVRSWNSVQNLFILCLGIFYYVLQRVWRIQKRRTASDQLRRFNGRHILPGNHQGHPSVDRPMDTYGFKSGYRGRSFRGNRWRVHRFRCGARLPGSICRQYVQYDPSFFHHIGYDIAYDYAE